MRIDASDDEKPVVKRGDWLVDERYGLVEVGGWSDAQLSWPYRKKTGTRSLILCGRLANDVRTKSETYICHAYGVGSVTVWSWRKALGVGRVTDGTRQLLRDNTGVLIDCRVCSHGFLTNFILQNT